MATDVATVLPVSLDGLPLDQIAALSTTHEVLARILPDGTVQAAR